MSWLVGSVGVGVALVMVTERGFIGAPLAAVAQQITNMIGMIIIAKRSKELQQCWGGWSTEALHGE